MDKPADSQAIADIQTGKIDKAIITVTRLPGMRVVKQANSTMRITVIDNTQQPEPSQ